MSEDTPTAPLPPCDLAIIGGGAGGVLVAMQDQARSHGANAVVDITSNYKKQEFSSPTQYECAAGAIMAGVALKGTYATVSR